MFNANLLPLLGSQPKDFFFQPLGELAGFPGGASGKEPACQCRRCGFDPWVGKIPWRRALQSTLVFLPGESHGQRILASYSPWGLKELDTRSQPARMQVNLGRRMPSRYNQNISCWTVAGFQYENYRSCQNKTSPDPSLFQGWYLKNISLASQKQGLASSNNDGNQRILVARSLSLNQLELVILREIQLLVGEI